MYEVFDRFLAAVTWPTLNPDDVERFYRALDQIVRDPAFDADALADHLLEHTGATIGEDDPRVEIIDHLHSNAIAVLDYLKATGGI